MCPFDTAPTNLIITCNGLCLGLTNDHKNIMLKIEQDLHMLHGQQREGVGLPANPATTAAQHTEPIAKVNFVASQSPADEAVS